jgi:PAS domain S-box-containing protein
MKIHEIPPPPKSAPIGSETADWINSIVKISYDLICDWNLDTDLISFGSNYADIFGYKLPNHKIRFQKWVELFPANQRTAIENKLKSILRSKSMNWEFAFRFVCPDGSVSQVQGRANIIRDKAGKAIRVIGIIHDISKEQKLEVKLEREAKIKEKQIVEAIVEAKEMERSDLGKELHDNVNQLLGASMLYLDMARTDIKNGEAYLIHASEYTLTAIEAIRKLTKGLASNTISEFGLSGAIGRIIKDTMEVNALRISFKLDQSLEDEMSDKFKLNAFRIFQEQLNNILKHSRASQADIAFTTAGTELKFCMTDNGIGFDTKQKANGIGMGNILDRAKLYKGSAEFVSKPGEGCKLALRFPLLSIY